MRRRVEARGVLKAILWVAVGLVLALYVGLPVVMAGVASWPSRAEAGDAPSGFEEVALETADGVKLSAWYRSRPIAPPSSSCTAQAGPANA